MNPQASRDCLVLSCLAGVLLWGAAGPAQEAEEQAYQHPVWRVARILKPPTIDGVIHEDEYAGIPAITGMVTWGGPSGAEKSIVAEVQQVSWRLGYDDKHVYLAMRSPHPKGTWPTARIKRRDDGAVLWDDHTEIQIATWGRRNYSAPGKGFYKIMTNAKGVWRDEWFYNGTPGTEIDWAIIGDHKASVTDERWDMEMRIALEAFREKSLDGRSWVMQLLRADAPGGVYFAGWVGEAWMSWNKFGAVDFDPRAPVFRFVRTGPVAKGGLDLVFEVIGGPAPSQNVTVAVVARDSRGKVLHRDVKTSAVKAREKTEFRFAKQVAWPKGVGNSLYILATYEVRGDDTGETKTVKLYEVKAPVLTLADDTEWNARVEPWLRRKPKSGQPEWTFCYWPSYGVAEASVDLDFFGMSAEIRAARRFRVDILSEKGSSPVARGEGAIRDLAGELVLESGALAPGAYTAQVGIIGAGDGVVYTDKRPFRRNLYAWEGSTVGEEDVLLPPFPAIKRHKKAPNTFIPWLREYTIGDDGLLARIRAEGGRGAEELLAGAVRLEAAVDGRTVTARDAKLEIGEVRDAGVDFSSTSSLGPAAVAIDGKLAFDGWYEVAMTIRPQRAGARLDRLTLVIPVAAGLADTMYLQRGSDSVAGQNKMGAIPEGEGVVWDSGRLQPVPRNTELWGTFAPCLYAGTGDKGVWWFCDENRDWAMSGSLPAAQYVRTGDAVEMRVNIFAEPVTLDRARAFRFAFLADPVKKMSNRRKIGWSHGGPVYGSWYAHNTFGWRQWGRSADGYYMLAEDRTALREFLQGLRKPGRPVSGGWRQGSIRATQTNAPIVLYGSGRNMMVDLPSFDTFSGEWLLRSFIPSDKKRAKSGGWNMQGSYENVLERDMQEVAINWTESQRDCFVWRHAKLLQECPVNGTWWDNRSMYQNKDYDPERKEFYFQWSTWHRRALCRRLNTVGWSIGRRPWWINNLHLDWSFNQVSWHIENDYYVDGPTNTILDQMSMDQFRAYARLKRGIIHRLAARYGGGEPATQRETRRQARNIIGMCLLHDIGAYRWGNYRDEHVRLPKLLDEHVGFFDEEEECTFVGYWRSAPLVEVGTPDIHISVYQGKGRAALVVVNANPKPVDVAFTLTKRLLGRDPVRLFDAETGQQFRRHELRDPKTRKYLGRAWGEYAVGRFGIENHGLRLLVAE